MDTLSSCYFCGTALDEPLATYGVGESDHAALTLCQGCHRKLETVFETAGIDQPALSSDPLGSEGDAVDGDTDASAADSHDGESAAAEQTEAQTPQNSGATDDEGETTEDDVETTQGDDTADTEVVTIVDASGDGSEVSDTTSDDSAGGDQAESATATATDTEPATEDDSEPASESESDTAETDDALTSGSDASDILVDPEADDALGSETSAETVESAGDESIETEMDNEADAGDPGDTETSDGDGESLAARTTISALEYNKVMRLLQNREFPVDRQEIEAVATNAYDLRQSECAEVIDLAVDRGLIDEREGQLHRPAEE